MKITIALCTRERPNMLSKCLKSIQSLLLPENTTLHVVVVENGESPNCEQDARSRMNKTPDIGFTYQNENKLGIATARNTSLECALKTNPDWIAFIDDDEVVPEDWLLHYQKAMATQSADAYTGPVERILTVEAPIWYKSPAKLNYENLCELDEAATNNTIANAEFFNGTKDSLRFDEAHNFSGGEDTKLFGTLARSGGIIRFVKDAVVYEYRTEARTSIKWMITGSYYTGNLNARMCIEINGRWNTLTKFFRKTISNLLHGPLFVIWGILITPFSRKSIRYLVKGLVKLAWVLGFFTGFFNVVHEQYKNKIEGN